ncbi:hypothetical protein [Corallococcus silvisoli]|uniref:hypothetical protein n=1 Tax=Corallococcus silvisoli TaxID=2697031 RepID=UPI0013782506|nr:hypothetical protein [Corallococcus silvisoli]NBD09633.1 hypothetical protein [Corallococcus silvisoli]
MAVTDADRAKMDAAVDEVRRLQGNALSKARDIRAKADGWFGALVTGAELAAAKAAEDMEPQVQAWATTRRREAEAGRRADGSTFSVSRFLELGRDLASAATLYTQEAVNGSLFAVVENTLAATKEEVQTVVNPMAWSTGAKVAAGAAVVVVVLAMLAPYVRR